VVTSRDTTWARWNTDWWDRQGVRGGLVGGGAFVLVGAVLARSDYGTSAGLWSLRLAASLLHGPAALDPDARLGPVLVTGTLIHLALSALFGLGFAILVAPRRWLRRFLPVLLGAGALYGLGLWLINVYAIAPTYGWTWAPEVASPLAQAMAHVLGFGLSLALYVHLAAVRRRRLGLD
jgi:hypothetical protein